MKNKIDKEHLENKVNNQIVSVTVEEIEEMNKQADKEIEALLEKLLEENKTD